MYGIMVLALEELHLERKNGEEFVHIPFDIPDTVLFPGPYLGRNIIEHRYLRPGMDKLGDIQVEPFSSLKKSGVDKLRQKLDSWFNEIPPQEAVEDAE